MQVLLKKSQSAHDIQCSACGQSFRLYWERASDSERATMRTIVSAELLGHHAKEHGGNLTPSAHPEEPFNLPAWSGPAQFSGAALLGGLSGIRRTAPRPGRSR